MKNIRRDGVEDLIMSDEDVDIRLLALKRQQKRRQSKSSVSPFDAIDNGRISSSRTAYEATPVKEYNRGTDSLSSRLRLSANATEEDVRIGRMQLPPVIRCECNGREASALLTSSETVSTMSLDFVQKIRLLDQIIPDSSRIFNPLSLNQRETKGRVKYIDLGIGSLQQVAQFIVVESCLTDITLGIDFLRRTQSILNFEDSSLTVGGIKGERIPFLNSREVMALARRNNNNNSKYVNGNNLSESE